ncbi:MAG: hypothetical protein NT147_01560, partial [Candidatus Aminicenantes bacterium]|nr:hypothetical protein [Candidatus Aminicenantes bacterium]
GNLSRAAAPASWKAVILPGGNLLGDAGRLDGSLGGYVYNDAENSVDVYATIGTMGKLYRTIFHMNVFFPAQVAFSGVSFIPTEFVDLGFPTGPLGTFINGPHPYNEQYLAIQFGFFGEYTTNKALADWTMMQIGATMPMRMYVSIDSKNLQGDCSECNPTDYHSIEINSFGAELKRTGTNAWTVHVDTNSDNTPDSLTYPAAYSSDEFIAEKYCTCVEQTVRKKTTMTKVIKYGAWGAGLMAFDIKFVTN